jgi:hypothetical protein
MPISKQVRHEIAQKGAAGRNSPDSYIRSLERADHLTAEQKFRLTRLVMSFFDDHEQAGGDAAGGEAA